MTIDTTCRDGAPERTIYYRVDTVPVWDRTTWLAAARPVIAPPTSDGEGGSAVRRARDREAGRVAATAAWRASGTAVPRGTSPSGEYPVSIAHSGGHGVAALHADCSHRIGIDLERSDTVSLRYADYFATRRELEACPFADVTVLWTLKEAAWKALRCEPSMPFHALETLWTTWERPRGLCLAGVEHSARFLVLVPWPGWILSVVSVEVGP